VKLRSSVYVQEDGTPSVQEACGFVFAIFACGSSWWHERVTVRRTAVQYTYVVVQYTGRGKGNPGIRRGGGHRINKTKNINIFDKQNVY
jgi:hypothetical protein